MDNIENVEDIFNMPVIPQSDWLSDAELDELEAGLSKVAQFGVATPAPVNLSEKRAKEHELLHSFQKSPSKDTFMPLYSSLKPLVISAAQKNMKGSQIPQAAHMARAAQSFLDAIRTYDPKKGGAFRTHAFNTVFEKGKRLNLTYQNIGYIPESRATKYQSYQTALFLLREELGREPSSLEIADESGIPVTEIERLRKEVKSDLVGQEHITSKGMGFAQSDKAMQVARDVIYNLEPKHQVVLEHMVGINGKQSLVKKSGKSDISAIAKATGLGINDVRSARKTIKRKFMEYRAFMGQNDLNTGVFDDSED